MLDPCRFRCEPYVRLMPRQQVARRSQPSPARSPSLPSAVPAGWEALWHHPEPTAIEWSRLVRSSRLLAETVGLCDEHSERFKHLVGFEELRTRPVHRWFTYKEGFSPRLLSAVIDALKLDGPLRVLDSFGGVATTSLSGQFDERVIEVRSVEYSPFAHFAGQVKLDWHSVDPEQMELLPSALAYPRRTDLPLPELAALHNPAIFHRSTVRSLLAAREHLRGLPKASLPERRFLLLGLAAVVEDVSGAMKDGRALRIKGERKRKPSSLATAEPAVRASGRIKRALAGQWTAMIEDLIALAGQREFAAATPSTTCEATHATSIRSRWRAVPRYRADGHSLEFSRLRTSTVWTTPSSTSLSSG